MKKAMVGLAVLALVGCGKSEKQMVQVGDDKMGTAHVKQLFASVDEPKAYAQAIGTFFDMYNGVAFMDNIGKDELIYRLVIDKANEISTDKRFEKEAFKPIVACQKAAIEFVQFADLRKAAGKQNSASDAHREPFWSNHFACKAFYEPPKPAPEPVAEIAPAPVLSKEQVKREAQALYRGIKAAQADGETVMDFLSRYPEQGGEIRDVSVKFNQLIDNSKLNGIKGGDSSCSAFAEFARLNWSDTYGLYMDEKRNAVTVSKIKMAEDTKKRLAQFEKECKEEIK